MNERKPNSGRQGSINDSVLLLGRCNCEKSLALHEFLILCGFDVKTHFFSGRKDLIVPDLMDWRGDYLFSYRCPVKIMPKIIKNTSKAAINFHPAPPTYRGSGGLNWALYNDDKEFGSTAHLITDQIDAGPIIGRSRFPIERQDNLSTLWKKSNQMTYEMAIEIIRGVAKDGLQYVKLMLEKNKSEQWSGKPRLIREIDELENISADCTAEEINRIIRATTMGEFRPYILRWGHKFELAKDSSEKDD